MKNFNCNKRKFPYVYLLKQVGFTENEELTKKFVLRKTKGDERVNPEIGLLKKEIADT